MGLDARYRWLEDPDSFYVDGGLAIHLKKCGSLPSKTTRTDRTIIFIIKVQYEEQT